MNPEPIGEEDVARVIIRELHRDCCEGTALDDICGLPLLDEDKRAARAAISAYLAALERAGWKCVPVEPTEAMLSATLKGYDDWRLKLADDQLPTLADDWRAMLAAAPLPQNSDEVKG